MTYVLLLYFNKKIKKYSQSPSLGQILLYLWRKNTWEDKSKVEWLFHAQLTSTKTKQCQDVVTHQATSCFHSVSRADDFSRWFQDDACSAGRRDKNSFTRWKKNTVRESVCSLSCIDLQIIIHIICVSLVCRSTAVAGLLAQVGRTSRTGCGTRMAVTWQSNLSNPDGWMI